MKRKLKMQKRKERRLKLAKQPETIYDALEEEIIPEPVEVPAKFPEALEVPEIKVAEIKKEIIMNKLLLVLDASKPTNRIIRRAIVMGVIALISVVITELSGFAPGYAIPIITAVLAALDKWSRIYKETK